MSIHFDRPPKYKQRRREIAGMLVNARNHRIGSSSREFWKAYCRGMTMAYWNDDNRKLFEGFKEGCDNG